MSQDFSYWWVKAGGKTYLTVSTTKPRINDLLHWLDPIDETVRAIPGEGPPEGWPPLYEGAA